MTDQVTYSFDHNFVPDNKEEVDITVYEPVSGRVPEVITDQPEMQLYTGNFPDETKTGHGGKPFNFRSALCLESGYYPDNPNHPDFQTMVINPGDHFRH